MGGGVRRRGTGVDSDAVDVPESLAKENGLRATFIRGDLRTIELPQFDVIAAMLYLNDPRRDEATSHLVYSLRDRFLKPGGVLIPNKVRYSAQGCEWNSQDYPTNQARLRSRINDLEGRFGLSLNALSDEILDRPWKSLFPEKVAGKLSPDRYLSAPVHFADIHYDRASTYPTTVELDMFAPGIFNTLI